MLTKTRELKRLYMRLDFRRLLYFRQVSEAGSLSGAAIKLCIAQPALTKAIRSLEADIGQVLFDRSPFGVTLTDAGRRLLHHSELIFSALDNAYLDLERGESRTKIVRLGLPYSIGVVLATPLLRETARRHPELQLSITEKQTQELSEALAAGELDLSLVCTSHRYPKLVYSEIAREEMLLVAPNGPQGAHLTLGMEGSISIHDLRSIPVILPARSASHRLQVEELLGRSGVILDNVRELDVFSMIFDHLYAGLGYSIMPAGWVHRAIKAGELRGVRFIEHETLSRTISMSRARYERSSKATEAVWSLVPETIRQVIESGDWQSARLL